MRQQIMIDPTRKNKIFNIKSCDHDKSHNDHAFLLQFILYSTGITTAQ